MINDNADVTMKTPPNLFNSCVNQFNKSISFYLLTFGCTQKLPGQGSHLRHSRDTSRCTTREP